uniref:Protein MAIN-LIKE 1-like n=1 Tax=Cicer arietinum TaxID=3827 RepID=A0A3Q7Y8E9_CICAR|nr:protein MAIN-LIKE 1-like [Cicer arietinum]
MFDAEQDEQPQHDHVFYDEYDQQQQQFDDEHGQQHQPDEPMFPGGPYDLSVLTDYEHHIAINVWNGQERRALKVVSNGKKQDKFIDIRYHLPAQIDHWINISGLRPLRRCSLHMIDGNMISAFAERWHAETSSFHQPFGEMTITLDDVRGLLSIPCTGEFFTPPANVNEDLAIAAAVELLGVTYDEAVTETRTNRGASYSFEWLKEVFYKKLHEGRYDCAARAYLLHLVGCTILADKSFTLVSAKYLFLFQDLDSCGKWAWGPAGLVVLYDYLRDSTLAATKQIGGYLSLFQTWIYEHFPDICKRDMDEHISSMPRMFRWTAKQTSGNVAYYRAKLDALRDTDIIWAPDYDQNAVTRFQSVSLFTGYIRWCFTMVPYLPERCIRQFGYTQHIPPTPPMLVARDVDVEWSMYRNSIPYVAAYVGPSYDADAGPSYDVDAGPSHDAGPDTSCTRCHAVGGLIQHILYLHMGGPEDEMRVLLERALYISRGGDYQ